MIQNNNFMNFILHLFDLSPPPPLYNPSKTPEKPNMWMISFFQSFFLLTNNLIGKQIRLVTWYKSVKNAIRFFCHHAFKNALIKWECHGVLMPLVFRNTQKKKQSCSIAHILPARVHFVPPPKWHSFGYFIDLQSFRVTPVQTKGAGKILGKSHFATRGCIKKYQQHLPKKAHLNVVGNDLYKNSEIVKNSLGLPL